MRLLLTDSFLSLTTLTWQEGGQSQLKSTNSRYVRVVGTTTHRRAMQARSRNYAWPLVVRDLAPKLFDKLLVRGLLQRPRIQEDSALVPPSSVVDERLGPVDAAAEERRRAHPCVGKLSAVLG